MFMFYEGGVLLILRIGSLSVNYNAVRRATFQGTLDMLEMRPVSLA